MPTPASPTPVLPIRRLAVYLAATPAPNEAFRQAVIETGEFLARHHVDLVFGGSREGTMGLLADTVLSRGGRVIGVFCKSLPSSFLCKNLSECIVADTLMERKEKMRSLADAFLALPGSFGTLDELCDVLAHEKMNLLFHGTHKPAGVLNVCGVYDHLLAFLRHMEDIGLTQGECRDLLQSGTTPGELFQKWNACPAAEMTEEVCGRKPQ